MLLLALKHREDDSRSPRRYCLRVVKRYTQKYCDLILADCPLKVPTFVTCVFQAVVKLIITR